MARRRTSSERAVERYVTDNYEDVYRVSAQQVTGDLYAVDITQNDGDHERFLIQMTFEQLGLEEPRSAT